MENREEFLNFRILTAVLKKEILRFFKVFHQTVIAPTITSLLFLTVFVLSIGQFKQKIHGVDFNIFMGAGLIIMSVVQNSFANSSSSLTQSRVLGSIIDYLIPPFGPMELVLGLMISSMFRGLLVGSLVALVLVFSTDIGIFSAFHTVFFILSSAMLLSLLGIITGIFADNFDKMAAITSYVITPFSFLSGTFYSIDNLPSFLRILSHFNPFFYMIDGFRFGITGFSDASVTIGMFVLIFANILAFSYAYFIIKTGYKLKN